MDDKKDFDFWYAVNNTIVHLLPSGHLETFGNTMLNYHLISEHMDSVNQIRIREGRVQAFRPQIITPTAYAQTVMEGFGEKAKQYVEWLKTHEQNIRILEYGYTLKQQSINEHTVSDTLQAVTERVTEEVKASGDPMGAVVIGVDDPWDVCLIKLVWEVIHKSVGPNINEMHQQRLLDDLDGVPRGIRNNIEEAFTAAAENPQLIQKLGKMLHKYGLFEQYQDRFFALYRKK